MLVSPGQILIAIATAAACAYWQHSAGIIAWAGVCTASHFGNKFHKAKA